jgi:hypothetical protein
MLFDGDGSRITLTPRCQEGERYGYYVSRPLITMDQPNGHEDLTHCACVLGVYLTTQSITRFVEKVLVERFEIVCKAQDLKTIAITYRPDL